jgi:hypothetical protein
MNVSRFGVKNYKCLGEVDIPLTPIHVLIGQNDAGKTSLLEAMAAFCAQPRELPETLPVPWKDRELVYHGSPEPRVDLWAEWTASDEEILAVSQPRVRYGFSIDFSSGGTACKVCNRRIALTEDSGDLGPWIALDGSPRMERLPAEKEADAAWRKVVSGQLKPAPKYTLNPRFMALPSVAVSDRPFQVEPDGYRLPTLLNDIVAEDPDRFMGLCRDFSRFFPQYTDIRLPTEKALSKSYDSMGRHKEGRQFGRGIVFDTPSGQRIRAQQASDGAILFLGFLALAHIPDPPNLLLIEEPENGIYPKRLGEVITMLKELVAASEGTRFPQIILSTHSPYVLSFFEPDEVTFLSRTSEKPDAPIRARPLRDAPDIRERMGDEFYLGELWYNLSEEELFRDV